MKSLVLALSILSIVCGSLAASASSSAPAESVNMMDELDPFSPDIQTQLEEMDYNYQMETGKDPLEFATGLMKNGESCYRINCAVWIQVVKDTQTAYLYQNGALTNTWKVSTGAPGHGTPNFDRHPNGRIYDSYTSKKFPGGDYNGLGNMPYAVFIEGGFAIHGTGRGNWPKLGRRASHGCIRLHPDNGLIFNRLVRANGIYNVWITVQ